MIPTGTHGDPLANSSVDRSGHPPATNLFDARIQLGASISGYLDGRPTTHYLASSVIDLAGDYPRLLRADAIDMDRPREIAPSWRKSRRSE